MPSPKILITGDITRDHFFRLGSRKYSDSPQNLEGTSFGCLDGGAGLVHQFLCAFSDPKTVTPGLDPGLFNQLPPQNKSYATIARVKGGKDKKEDRWKIQGQFGFGKVSGNVDYAGAKPVKSVKDYNMVIIDDAGMDFGSLVNQQKVWPWIKELRAKKNESGPELLICKKSGDLQKGELWKELLAASGEGRINLVSVVSISDIRRQEARVSSGISWEQSALDLVFELKNNVNLSSLLKSRLLIITFGSAGAVIISGKGTLEYRLVFDPRHLEGDWEGSLEGTVIGNMSCFTAAFATSLDLTKPNKDYLAGDAVIKGLAAIRGFNEAGYAGSDGIIAIPPDLNLKGDAHILTYSSAFIPSPGKNSEFLVKGWSILLDNHKEKARSAKAGPGSMFELARRIVTNGRHVLGNVPSIEFGMLFTADRAEIEGLRNLKMLMENYRDQKKPKNPLSIAVFGLPGSGKSFSVKQIGKGVLGDKVPILEFNLSQFAGPADLIGAFHQVRDEVLKGSVPLVFWDEFDSKKYEWLQYLLAPMQDGTFQEGQATHTIGKCIMVFAGGTSYKMEFFGDFDGKKEEMEAFKLKKGPDFISRIHGYINILGPNPGLVKNTKTKKWETDKEDSSYPIRRALFIRTMMGLKDKDILGIDWGLLNALLKVGKYKHGSRSLENLLKSLRENSDGRRILRCHLPSNAILKLYIEDPDEFLALMNENMGFYETTFALAPAIHEAWADHAKTINPDYATEFNMLPVFIKASNLAAAIRIPQVLGKAKLKIVPKGTSGVLSKEEYQRYLKQNRNRYLEKMSEEEHRLWMDFYLSNDWHYNATRNDYEKLHNCLVAFHDSRLTESDKDKDRDQVLKYWVFLDKAGFGIVAE